MRRRKNATRRGRRNAISGFQNDPANIFAATNFMSTPASLPFELSVDNNYMPITLNRILLTYTYSTHGVIQTAIDQPVEDALKGGVKIKCDELDDEDLKLLMDYVNKNLIPEIKNVLRWARLYGGGGLIANTDQPPEKEFDLEAIDQDTPLSFIAADRWELLLRFMEEQKIEAPYTYYGIQLHKSRVLKVMGKKAPSFLAFRLQGWGMSELERMIRPLNMFLKTENVAYELMDEAKIDVWKIQDYNSNILKPLAQNATSQRLQIATQLKNYHNAITMDSEDDYQQKQITFSGLAEMLVQNRISIASALKIPITKLFGLSANGFSSGEDDLENYNSMVESTIRPQIVTMLDTLLPICCAKIFGVVPEKIEHEFYPLRILSAEGEENIKNAKFNRYSTQYSQGMLRGQEYAEILRQEDLCPMDTEVLDGAEPEPPESPSATYEKAQQAVTAKVPEA